MKILFDNQAQKDSFTQQVSLTCCPAEFGLKDDPKCNGTGCIECWNNSGIEMYIVGELADLSEKEKRELIEHIMEEVK